MRKSRFSEIPIIHDLEKRSKVDEAVRRLSRARVSEATYYRWKARYGGIEAADIRRSRGRCIVVWAALSHSTWWMTSIATCSRSRLTSS